MKFCSFIVLFFFCLNCFAQSYIVSVRKGDATGDSTVKKPSVKKIGRRLDTLDTRHVVVSADNWIKIERENAELKVLVQSAKDENDKRFAVFLWGIGIVITLMLALIVGTAYRSNLAARETAKSEIETEMGRHKKTFDDLKEIQEKQIQEFAEVINALKEKL